MTKLNLKLKFCLITFFLFELLGLVRNSQAAEINAISCAQQDVQIAIDSANNGDTVYVPAGNCTWTTTTAYTSSVVCNKEIAIVGAGYTQTVIVDGTGSLFGEELIKSSGDNWRLSGFTFTGMKRRSATEPALIASGTGWRVDNCKFFPVETSSWDNGRGMYAYGTGVIDNNIFYNTYQGVAVFGGDGDTIWSEALTLGTANAVYIEDNTFDYTTVALDGAFDAYSGAKVVFRYNTVNGTIFGTHGFDTGGYRAAFSYEVYNNTFNKSTTGTSTICNIRGGTGVIFNNTITGNYRSFGVANYRSCTDYSGIIGLCDGTNANDGNTDPTETNHGWPCKDQIGRTTNQTSYPLHEWNNTINGQNANISVNDFCDGGTMGTAHVVAGRDYFNDTEDPLYTPYTYPHPLRVEVAVIRSDADNNSTTNTTDALLTLRNSLGLSMTATAWQASVTTGDVDCNGISNSTDALLILRYSLGLEMGTTAWCEGN